MDIALYIATLLNQHNEVNIPGLGTCFQKRIHGFYDRESNLFVPPSHQLAFRQEQGKSLMLANYCCSQRKISQKTAIYFIEKFVKIIWEQLNTAGYADINPVGTLKKSDNGYTLEAKENVVQNNTYYGLKPVQERSLEAVLEVIPPAPTILTDLPKETPIVKDDSIPYNKEARKPVIETILAFVALLLFAIMAGYYFYPDTFKSIIQQNPFAPKKHVEVVPAKTDFAADSTTQVLVAPSDTLQLNHIELTEPHTEPQADTIQVHAGAVAPVRINYEIVGASFSKKAEAERYVAHLQSNGISAKIASDIPGPRSKVSYGSFTDKKTAETELRRIRKELNPDAWMATVTPHKP